MKAELPNFINIVSIGKGKGIDDWVDINTRLNPYHITSYHETFITNYKGEELKKIIVFHVATIPYYVDMTIEEADKMMDDIDRSLSFKEND